jgi:hypothetical protein
MLKRFRRAKVNKVQGIMSRNRLFFGWVIVWWWAIFLSMAFLLFYLEYMLDIRFNDIQPIRSLP